MAQNKTSFKKAASPGSPSFSKPPDYKTPGTEPARSSREDAEDISAAKSAETENTVAWEDAKKQLQIEPTITHTTRLMRNRAGFELLCAGKVIAADLNRDPKWKLTCPVCKLYIVAGMSKRNNMTITEYKKNDDGSMEPRITNDR